MSTMRSFDEIVNALAEDGFWTNRRCVCPSCQGAGELEIPPEIARQGIAYARCAACQGSGQDNGSALSKSSRAAKGEPK